MALGNLSVLPDELPAWASRAPRTWSKNQRAQMKAMRAAMEAANANPIAQNPFAGQQLALPAGPSYMDMSHVPPAQRAAAEAARGLSGTVGGSADDAFTALSRVPAGQQAAAQAARGGGVGRMALGQALADSAAAGTMGGAPIPMGAAPSRALVPWVDDAARAAAGSVDDIARMTGPEAVEALMGGAGAAGRAAAPAVEGAAATRLTGAAAYQAAKAAAEGGRFAGMRAGIGAAAKANPWGLGAGIAGAALPMVWNDPNSKLDNAASWGLQGAGLGSMFGPVGAVVGGAGGSMLGYMMAGDAGADADAMTRELTTQRSKLTNILNQAGASPDFVRQAQTQLDLLAMNATSKDQIATIMEGLTQQLIPSIAQDMQQQAAERMRASNVAAMQSWMGPMMQDALNRQQYYADQSASAQSRTANNFADPALRSAANSLASRTSLNAANSATRI